VDKYGYVHTSFAGEGVPQIDADPVNFIDKKGSARREAGSFLALIPQWLYF